MPVEVIAFNCTHTQLAVGMENYSSFDNQSSLYNILPIGAVAFTPFLLLELVAAFVSNALLLALVILACVKKLNNNINIYLFSLAIGGLMGTFNIFCLLTLVIARRWVLGVFICNVSYSVVMIYVIIFTLIFLFISRDKLKGVKDPLRGRPSKKIAYIQSVVFWIGSIAAGIIPLVSSQALINRRIEIFGDFACFGLTSRLAGQENRFISSSITAAIYFVISFIIILITLSNFVRILLELRKLRKLRQRSANENRKTIKIDGRVKPLYRTGEERTAVSLTLVYFIQFTCTIFGSIMIYTQAILRNYVLSEEIRSSADYQLYFAIVLIVQHFPCVTPILFIWSNKRLRNRMKDLFMCTLNPEEELSPVHVPKIATTPSTNKVTPIISSASDY